MNRELSSTEGLFWLAAGFAWGILVGFALRLLTYGPWRQAGYQRHDNLRVGAGALAIMYARTTYEAILNGSVYHRGFVIGDFWAVAFSPLMCYGIAIGYGLGRGRAGVFHPVTHGIADE